MATDAVIQFNVGDEFLSAFYKRTDAYPETIVKHLKEAVEYVEQDEKDEIGRLNWGYVVARVTYLIHQQMYFVHGLNNIKTVHNIDTSDRTFIYRWIITTNDKYSDKKYHFAETIDVHLYYQIGGKTLYKGSLADFKIEQDV